MSFKRAHDSSDVLLTQQANRQRDLLGESINPTEVKQLSNGKWACVVCCHCPVFDTVPMLATHRHGKKHTNALQLSESRDESCRQKRLQRAHLACLQSEEQESGREGKIVQKRRTPYSRKPTLAVGGHSPSSDAEKVTARRGPSLRNEHFSRYVRCVNSALVQSAPSKISTEAQKVEEVDTSSVEYVRPWRVPRHLREKHSTHSTVPGPQPAASHSTVPGPQPAASHSTVPGPQPAASYSTVPGPQPAACSTPENAVTALSEKPPCVRLDERDQRLLRLRGDGWKKDWDGRWIRDADAEFESDEDEPEEDT